MRVRQASLILFSKSVLLDEIVDHSNKFKKHKTWSNHSSGNHFSLRQNQLLVDGLVKMNTFKSKFNSIQQWK